MFYASVHSVICIYETYSKFCCVLPCLLSQKQISKKMQQWILILQLLAVLMRALSQKQSVKIPNRTQKEQEQLREDKGFDQEMALCHSWEVNYIRQDKDKITVGSSLTNIWARVFKKKKIVTTISVLQTLRYVYSSPIFYTWISIQNNNIRDSLTFIFDSAYEVVKVGKKWQILHQWVIIIIINTKWACIWE